MYSINTKDCVQFGTFLALNANDFVDVILSEDTAMFVLNSNEIFSMVGAKCTRSSGENDVSFKVSRNLIKNLYRNGNIEVTFHDKMVTLSFYDGYNCFCWSMTVRHLQTFDFVYADKIKLLSNINECPRFSGLELAKAVKVASLLGGVINVDSGVISITHKLMEKIYISTSIKGTFALTVDGYYALRKCNTKFFSIADYVGASLDNFVVLAKKVRAESNSEFSFICGDHSEYKSKYVADYNFSNLVQFFNNNKIATENIDVDVVSQSVTLNVKDDSFRIPIIIKNERRSQGAVFDHFVMPAYIITKVLKALGVYNVRLSKKKTFIELFCNDQNEEDSDGSKSNLIYVLF